MVFSSLIFLYQFFPLVLLLYFVIPGRFRTARNLVLLLFSLLFYSWGEPKAIWLMIGSILLNYVHGWFVQRFCDRGERKKARAVVISAVVLNLLLLGIFKYANFFLQNISAVLGREAPLLSIALPIGISFYTFQSLSYAVDIYRGEARSQKNIVAFGMYVTFFPQLIAGPIVTFHSIADQLKGRTESRDQFSRGISRFLQGLGKKVLLANSIGLVWEQVSAMPADTLPALTAWIGLFAFAFQIYFDFSGYSDMAIGMGKMLGFNFPQNFNYPYMSKSVSEFWRRWHITLGSWFKEYVYFPLGGSRCSKLKTVRNLLIVWLLTGLWHGASFNFLLWGLWFGALIVIEHLWLGRLLKRLPGAVSWLYTSSAVLFGWVLFDTATLSDAWSYFAAMFGGGGSFADYGTLAIISESAISFALCIFFAYDAVSNYISRIGGDNSRVVVVLRPLVTCALLIACTSYLVNSGYNPFLYFNF